MPVTALVHYVASEPFDSLWKISAGLITPTLIYLARKVRNARKQFMATFDGAHDLIVTTVPAMASTIAKLEKDVSGMKATIADHTDAIDNATRRLSETGSMADVVSGMVVPLMVRMAAAAEARAELNASRSPSRADDPPDADFIDKRVYP